MMIRRKIEADHKDIIHHVAFDYYGKRMATCSSDHCVKIWNLDANNEWKCVTSWKAHSGSVWKVNWAHPEFGQVIATCSFDRTAVVWEEILGSWSAANKSQTHWIKKTSLVDSRTSVTDVEFAPKHLGLQLATSSADGVIRIYEAADLMNLSQWSLLHEINCKLTLSCISWNLSSARFHAPLLAASSDESGPGAKVFLFEYSEQLRQWSKIDALVSVTQPVHDIAFAPNAGRSYHLLAVASKDLCIFILRPVQSENGLTVGRSPHLEVHLAACFKERLPCVWRVSWNASGTILSSASDDGCIRLWKKLKGDCAIVHKDTGKEDTSLEVTQGSINTKYYKLGTTVGQAAVKPWA